jgi:hypothetical protein
VVAFSARQRLLSAQHDDGRVRSVILEDVGMATADKPILVSTDSQLVVLAAFDGVLQVRAPPNPHNHASQRPCWGPTLTACQQHGLCPPRIHSASLSPGRLPRPGGTTRHPRRAAQQRIGPCRAPWAPGPPQPPRARPDPHPRLLPRLADLGRVHLHPGRHPGPPPQLRDQHGRGRRPAGHHLQRAGQAVEPRPGQVPVHQGARHGCARPECVWRARAGVGTGGVGG